MAAGLGFKTFTTGEVLTAADTNGYLMQGINVFASTAARDAAITSPQEGQFAFTKDTNGLWYYDGAAWVASGATGDIEGVTAGVGISGGGTSGTVTVTNSMATAIDAKGDLVAGTGADAFSRLAVGANDTVLTADSAQATGLKWAAPASSSGPTFSVYLNSAQTITTATLTKVQLATEVWDSDNCYDNTTNYRFTPTKSGYYLMTGYMYSSGTSATRSIFNFHRNGNLYARFFDNGTGNWIGNGSTLMYFNGTTDYAELYTYLTGTNLKIEAGQEFTSFSGVWIRS